MIKCQIFSRAGTESENISHISRKKEKITFLINFIIKKMVTTLLACYAAAILQRAVILFLLVLHAIFGATL
jgi:hypothetical protein